MTANRRIFLNIVATYGRSLYALVLGLFTARWVLMALGEVDFGLYGVVGGLTAFVGFINELLAMSVARFFAVSVGAAHKEGNEIAGIEESKKWFNTALLIHTIVPVILVIIGYPIGEWAVREFLTIPIDRVNVCVWVWRFTCLSCFVGMITVPFRAMYTAKQEIAELTVYSFATTTVNAIMLYYMVTHPAEWLFKYAFYTCLISIVPSLIIAYRAVVTYPECRLVMKYLYSRHRLKEISAFAFARFFTSFSSILVSQGQAILVNKYLGPRFNAAMRVGATVSSQASTLAGSLSGAFWPAIANTVGEGDEDKVRRMSFQECKFATVLIAIFAIPLGLEVHEVMRLWLVTPPVFAAEVCIFILISGVVDRMTEGYWMAIMGMGRQIPRYSWWVSWSSFIGLAVTWIMLVCSFGMLGICYAIIVGRIVCTLVRIYLGADIAGLSTKYWLRRVFCPLVMVLMASVAAGFVLQLFLPRSFMRICLTTVVCEMVMLPLVWLCVLAKEERRMLHDKIINRISFLRRKYD